MIRVGIAPAEHCVLPVPSFPDFSSGSMVLVSSTPISGILTNLVMASHVIPWSIRYGQAIFESPPSAAKSPRLISSLQRSMPENFVLQGRAQGEQRFLAQVETAER